MANAHRTNVCQICGQTKPQRDTLPAILVRPAIDALIRREKPDWSNDGFICLTCLNRFRTQFVREQMERERGELTSLEHEVLHALVENESVVENLNRSFAEKQSLGDRIADSVAKFGGSWIFIFIFGGVLLSWVAVNTIVLMRDAFDPYPFILLNLFLSMLAAIQAPIIMMSQNRAAARDRMQAEQDFRTNLKAEIEVRAISEKLDQLLHNQWMRLLEIQQIQMEMLEDLAGKRSR